MNKKATTVLGFGILVGVFVVLTIALVGFHYRYQSKNIHGLPDFIGQKQSAIISAYQDAEKVKTYVDFSSGYSYENALYAYGEHGGLVVGKEGTLVEQEQDYPCGSFIYSLWNDEEKECYPDYKKNFVEYFEKELNNYLVMYPEILPLYNYEYEWKDVEPEMVKLVGVAKEPVKLDVKIGEAEKEKVFRPYVGGLLQNPLQGYTLVESCFGFRGHVGYTIDHAGIDLPAPRGTEVYAAASGSITAIEPDRWGRIWIDHGDFITEYLHLDKVVQSLKVGDKVNQGELIGYVGGRGPQGVEQYGNHLHFGVLDKNADVNLRDTDSSELVLESFDTKQYINPLCFFGPEFTLSDSLACHASPYCKPTQIGEECSQGSGAYKGCDKYELVQELIKEEEEPETEEAEEVVEEEFEKKPCSARADFNQLHREVVDTRITMAELQQLIDETGAETYIKEAHRKYPNVPEELIKAFLRVESRRDMWKPEFICTRSICGVMQTTQDLCDAESECDWDLARIGTGVRDSIFAGTRHLSQLLQGKEKCMYVDKNNPDYYKVALCYNAGHNVANNIISFTAARVFRVDVDKNKDKDKKKEVQWRDVTIDYVRAGLRRSKDEHGEELYYKWGGEDKVEEIYEYPNLIMYGLEQYCGEDYTYQPEIIGEYSFRPHFILEKENSFTVYDRLIEFSEGTTEECSASETVRVCVEEAVKDFNKEDEELFLSLGCEDSSEEMLYDFIEGFEYCKLSEEKDCICNMDVEELPSAELKIDKYWLKYGVEDTVEFDSGVVFAVEDDDYAAEDALKYEVRYKATGYPEKRDLMLEELRQGSTRVKQRWDYPMVRLHKNNGEISFAFFQETNDKIECVLPEEHVGICEKALEGDDEYTIGLCSSPYNKPLLYFVDEYEKCKLSETDDCYCHIYLLDKSEQDFDLWFMPDNKLVLKKYVKSSQEYPYKVVVAESPYEKRTEKDSFTYEKDKHLYKSSDEKYIFVDEIEDKNKCKVLKNKFRFCARDKNDLTAPEIRFGLTITDRIPPARVYFGVERYVTRPTRHYVYWNSGVEEDIAGYKLYHSNLMFNSESASYYEQIKAIELDKNAEEILSSCILEDQIPLEKHSYCLSDDYHYYVFDTESSNFAVVAVDEAGNEMGVDSQYAIEKEFKGGP